MNKRIAEINNRLTEINIVLRKNENCDIDALDKEVRDLLDEKDELETREKRQATANGIENGSIEARTIHKPGEDIPFVAASKTQIASASRAKSYRSMFFGKENKELDKGEFRSFNEFMSVIHSGRFDERLQKRAFSGQTGVSGGFSVPDEFAAWLMDNSIEQEIVRPRAQVWPMLTDTKKIPAWDGNDHSSNLFGGISGVWVGETQTSSKQTGKMRLLQLTAKKLACFTQASNELIDDGMEFEDQLGLALSKAMGWFMDYAFLNGTGVGQPLGVLNDPALITVNKENGQTADTIVYENLTKMFARIAPSSRKNAVWVANDTTIPLLLSLNIAIGTAGSHVPVLTESNGEFKILTRPVIFTEKVPSLGSKGDISLIDFSQYAVGLRKDVYIDKNNAPGWTEDMSDYRAILRADGLGTWDKPLTPKNGETQSWCVTLEARE